MKKINFFKKIEKYCLIIVLICFVLTFVLAIFSPTFEYSYGTYNYAIFTAIPIFILMPVIFLIDKKALIMYKQQFLKPILYETFGDITYNPKKGLSKKEVYQSKLFSGSGFESNDLIEGNYNNYTYRLSDVNIYRTSGNKGNRKRTTVFCGPWIILDYPISTNGKITIKPKVNLGQPANELTGIANNLVQYAYKKVNKSNAISGNSVFDSKFNILSSTPEDISYVLTQELIQKMLFLENMDYNISYAFFNNQLHIAVNTYTDSFANESINEYDDSIIELHKTEIETIKTVLDLFTRII